jgi:hypothetical protein
MGTFFHLENFIFCKMSHKLMFFFSKVCPSKYSTILNLFKLVKKFDNLWSIRPKFNQKKVSKNTGTLIKQLFLAEKAFFGK